MDQYLYRHQSQRHRRNRRLKFYLGSAAFVLLCVGAAYTVLYSPIFRVRSIAISGEGYLTDADVLSILEPREFMSYASLFLGPANLLAWTTSRPDIADTPLADAAISRDWLRQTVAITIKERERFAIWCDAQQNCAWIDRNAVPFQSAPQAEGSLILTIHDAGTGRLTLNSPAVEERFAGNLAAIATGLTGLRLPIKTITYDPRTEEITVESYRWPKLLFSIRFDPTTAISSLYSLEQKTDVSPLLYIDLRVENRIYYK